MPFTPPYDQQQMPMKTAKPKAKTLREIIEGLENKAPNIEFLGRNPWRSLRTNDTEQRSIYEQYLVKDKITARALRRT